MEIMFTKILSKSLNGKNISAVAREIGMPRNLLHDWSKAKRIPSLSNIDYIKKLADYLGLTLDELLVGGSSRKVISNVRFSDAGTDYQIMIEKINQ